MQAAKNPETKILKNCVFVLAVSQYAKAGSE